MESARQPLRIHDQAPTTPPAVRGLAAILAGAAVAIGIALVATGAPTPSVGPLLLLAVVGAVCVNRFALFPSEHAATAEAAVVLAAVAGFRVDAPFLGPLALALLLGVLDAVHWEQRSFVRMAYNAGNRGVAALAAAGALAVEHGLVAHPSASLTCAFLVGAALAFAVVDLACSTALLRCFRVPVGEALRLLLDVDALTLAIACYGAFVGVALLGIGWWAIALALLPVAFVPELVVARARGIAPVVRDLVAVFAIVLVVASVAVATSSAPVATLVMLAVISALVGLEVMADRGAVVAAVLAVVVVAGGAVVDDRRVALALVAVGPAVAVSWCIVDRGRRSARRLGAGLAVAFGGALAAAATTDVVERGTRALAVAALVGGVVFQAVVVLAGDARRRRALAAAWTLPLVGAAVAWAMCWRAVGRTGGLVFGVALLATMAGMVWWAAPTWRSRLLQPVMAGRGTRGLGGVVALLAIAAVVTTAIAHGAERGSAASGWAWAAIGMSESLTAMTALGVHQWRFAPRPRAVGLATTASVSAVLLVLGPPLARGQAWAAAALCVLLVVVLAVARRPVRACGGRVGRVADRR